MTKRGGLGFDDLIDAEKYEALIALMRKELAASYPHLEFGGYFST